MKGSKWLITGAILSVALALYQVVFQPMYEKWLESQGRVMGVGEVALGYFAVWLFTSFIVVFVTRNMGGKEKS